MNTPLTLKDFDYSLPNELVAQVPLPDRDGAKLLQFKDGEITHEHVKRLAHLVPAGSLFIVNDSKVIASRIRFQLPTGANAEFLLLEPLVNQPHNGSEDWLALGRPKRRLRGGSVFDVGHGLQITVLETIEEPGGEGSHAGPKPFVIRVSMHGSEFLNWLSMHGEMPLPPYIERRDASEGVTSEDKIRYQTVYADLQGSVAAPTAGLHFTETVMDQLKKKHCEFAFVTLHVGAGTFLPVKTSNIADHEMHEERFLVPKATLVAIERAKKDRRAIIVVGTTALRSLEGLKRIAVSKDLAINELADQWHRTDIFIRPEFAESRYKSWVASALMTNFHQPESTLLMLVSALVGYETIKAIYKNAIANQYRFFSYGDSSLLWLN